MSTIDTVWRARDTNPGDIDAALRFALSQIHRENTGYVPARVMNLICVVDKSYSGEIANRLRRVGRYHPSRTIVCSVEPGRTTLDAVATIAAPLVVTDLLTAVWAPHGHADAVDSLLDLAQVVLIDSIDEPDPADAIHRARQLSEKAYVVDLAWLRSTPWRERVAATFDPVHLRPDLRTISAVTIRHHPDSVTAALLVFGWLAARLDWRTAPMMKRGGAWVGTASTRRQDVRLTLEADPTLQVRGLAGLTLETASGRHLSLDRGPGGLRARYRHKRGTERQWTILGASRGESGILGEGIRQALLRDHTYAPALHAAEGLLA
jgi:glucose-6-phosphate dehydrogenase assembly protein OpcA